MDILTERKLKDLKHMKEILDEAYTILEEPEEIFAGCSDDYFVVDDLMIPHFIEDSSDIDDVKHWEYKGMELFKVSHTMCNDIQEQLYDIRRYLEAYINYVEDPSSAV